MVKDDSDTDFTFINFPALCAQVKVYDCVHTINNKTHNVTCLKKKVSLVHLNQIHYLPSPIKMCPFSVKFSRLSYTQYTRINILIRLYEIYWSEAKILQIETSSKYSTRDKCISQSNSEISHIWFALIIQEVSTWSEVYYLRGSDKNNSVSILPINHWPVWQHSNSSSQRFLKLVQLQYRMWFTRYKEQSNLVKEGIYSDPSWRSSVI
jgi:hypothetical protein